MGVFDIGGLIDPGAVLSISAGALAVASGMAFGDYAYQALRRRNAATSMLASSRRERLLLRLKGGIGILRKPSEWLMGRIPSVGAAAEGAAMLASDSGIALEPGAFVSLLMGAAMSAVLIGWIVGGSPVFGIAIGCSLFIGVLAFVRNRADKKSAEMREAIPEALRVLAMSFRSGHSLTQVLADSSRDCSGYLGHLFSVASDRLDMGATPSEALSVMRGNSKVPELSFVAVALDVQHESGGSIAPVLESAIDSVNGELKLERSLRVQTAQARLSASIVTAMPFLLVALFSFMSPDFLSPFFSSLLGMAVLSVALVMQLSGVLMVRRMLNVDLD